MISQSIISHFVFDTTLRLNSVAYISQCPWYNNHLHFRELSRRFLSKTIYKFFHIHTLMAEAAMQGANFSSGTWGLSILLKDTLTCMPGFNPASFWSFDNPLYHPNYHDIWSQLYLLVIKKLNNLGICLRANWKLKQMNNKSIKYNKCPWKLLVLAC